MPLLRSAQAKLPLCYAAGLLTALGNFAAATNTCKTIPLNDLTLAMVLNLTEPVIVNEVGGSWPELGNVKEMLQEREFEAHGKWGSARLLGEDFSNFGGDDWELLNTTAGEATAATFKERPFNLFVRSAHEIVRGALAPLAATMPQPLELVKRDGPFLSVGRTGQGNPAHAHEKTVFVQLLGAKRWLLMRPKKADRRKLPSAVLRAREVCSYLQDPDGQTELHGFLAWTCDLQEEEMLLVPAKWRHATCNLADWTVGAALTGEVGSMSSLKRSVLSGNFSEVDRECTGRQQQSRCLEFAIARGRVDVVQHMLRSPWIRLATSDLLQALGTEALEGDCPVREAFSAVLDHAMDAGLSQGGIRAAVREKQLKEHNCRGALEALVQKGILPKEFQLAVPKPLRRRAEM
mmetsp:Transcript_54528/g.100913  ORF Transcript_54528/g.100913 Transcript_54528/m.100913 type:complete len:405 (+) Transcript_54528:112-1326(+)